VKQLLDANIPNYELQHVYTVKKNTGLFQNQKKLEREGRIIVFVSLWDSDTNFQLVKCQRCFVCI